MASWYIDQIREIHRRFSLLLSGDQMAKNFRCGASTISEWGTKGSGPLLQLMRFLRDAQFEGADPSKRKALEEANESLADLICKATGHIAIRPPRVECGEEVDLIEALHSLIDKFSELVKGVNQATKPGSEGGIRISESEHKEIQHLIFESMRAHVLLSNMTRMDFEEFLFSIRGEIKRLEE